MRLGIAKIDEQAIAEILRNMPRKALDDLGTGGVIRADHLAEIFGIELGGESCGLDEVAEEDRELTAFGLSGRPPRGEPPRGRTCLLPLHLTRVLPSLGACWRLRLEIALEPGP